MATKAQQDWYNFQKAQAEDLYGAGARFRGSGGGASSHALAMQRQKFQQSPLGAYYLKRGQKAFDDAFMKKYQGGYSHRAGAPMTDRDMQQYFRMNGINPPGSSLSSTGYGRNTGYAYGGGAPYGGAYGGGFGGAYGGGFGGGRGDLLSGYLGALQAQTDAANAANEARYQEILGNKAGLRERVMGRVGNWGHAASGDLERRSEEAMGDIHSELAGRGLANSTILPSFLQRNKRDLAREQQRLSEMRDTRFNQNDIALANDRDSFIERRTDEQPDLNAYYNLISQAAQGGLPWGGGMGFGQPGGMPMGGPVGPGQSRSNRGFQSRGLPAPPPRAAMRAAPPRNQQWQLYRPSPAPYGGPISLGNQFPFDINNLPGRSRYTGQRGSKRLPRGRVVRDSSPANRPPSRFFKSPTMERGNSQAVKDLMQPFYQRQTGPFDLNSARAGEHNDLPWELVDDDWAMGGTPYPGLIKGPDHAQDFRRIEDHPPPGPATTQGSVNGSLGGFSRGRVNVPPRILGR